MVVKWMIVERRWCSLSDLGPARVCLFDSPEDACEYVDSVIKCRPDNEWVDGVELKVEVEYVLERVHCLNLAALVMCE